AEVDPALRAARDRAAEVDEHHHPERPGIDRAAEAAVDVGVHEQRDEEGREPRGGEDPLPDDVVARAPWHVEPRDPVDRPEPEPDAGRGTGEEEPVEPPKETELLRRRPPALPRRRPCPRARVLQHQSEWIGPTTGAFVLKKCSNTFSAAGAAAVPPWPPFSIS